MAQIPDIKVFSKGMNKDVDPRFLEPGEYIDGQNIMLSNYRSGRGGGITNFPGLLRRYDTAEETLGLFKDELNNVLYIFTLTGSTGTIRRYNLDDETTTVILTSTALPFQTGVYIKSCHILEGIIFWTDGTGEIGMYDTNMTYGTPTAEMLTLAKPTPQKKPTISPETDSSYGYNNILGKFFQFKYRYIYQNGQKTVFSPISEVAYSFDDFADPALVSSKATTVNSINVTMHGEGANALVDKVELAVRSGNNGDFFSVKIIDADSTLKAGGDQSFRFYNESLYAPISLEESNQIYDDVPQNAQTLVIADNRVILGDVKNGYDKVELDYDISVVLNDGVAPLTAKYNTDDAVYLAAYPAATPRTPLESSGGSGGLGNFMNTMFSYPTPVAGDQLTCVGVGIAAGTWLPDYIHPFGDVTITVETGDGWAEVLTKLLTPTFHDYYTGADLTLMGTATNPPDAPTGNDGFQIWLTRGQHSKTFKSGSWLNVGIQYFDLYGRTNGAQYKEDSRIYIPTIPERDTVVAGSYTDVGAVDILVTIKNEAPSWAAYYKIVYSRAAVTESSIQISTLGAAISGTNNVIIDIGSIALWNEEKGGNLSYVWEKGDRVKVITRGDLGGTVYLAWASGLIDAEIIGDDSTGSYSIIVPRIADLNIANSVAALNNGVTIEIYRPSKELDATEVIFTEANPDYQIYYSSGHYYHRGDTDQSLGVDGLVTITGDAYIKNRVDFPVAATTADIAFESYDISDYRESQHYDKGRPTAIINQEQSQRVSTIMYSEFIIPNTDINNLNRFYPDVNFEEYEKPFGKIVHLYSEEDHILMLQEDRVSKVFVNRSMMYDGQGNGQLIGTQQQVLSQSVPYAGLYGIHDARSFQAIGNRRYWIDAARGVVLRLSQNGIEDISRYGMRGWFAEKCESLLDSVNEKVTSAYDVQNDLYLIHLDAAGKTLYFDEKTNSWVSFITFINADHSVFINNRTFVIELNDIYEMNYYTHMNSAYPVGSVQLSSIKFESCVEPAEVKNYYAIAIDGSHPMDVAITTEALYGGTNQSSTLDRALDFRQRETEWHAAFLRDVNTPKINPDMTAPNWTASALFLGDTLKGKSATITLTHPASVGDQPLTMKLVKVIVSKG